MNYDPLFWNQDEYLKAGGGGLGRGRGQEAGQERQ
jgi:hypothetical protein